MTLKLGKLPARKDAVLLKLRTYSEGVIPNPPSKYGHQSLVTNWGMLGNDQYGDCVWAGAAHETMLWNKTAGVDISIVDKNALSDYSTVTGFKPSDPSTDQGTDMQVAASYRKKTGIIDNSGKRHQVGAYLAITPGSKTEIKQALSLFGLVGIGIQFPSSAMDQFNAGKSWTAVKSTIEGGHYVPIVGYDSSYVYVVTWGKVQKATWAFISKYMDEGIVYLSQEFLKNGKTIDGFDLPTLQTDLNKL